MGSGFFGLAFKQGAQVTPGTGGLFLGALIVAAPAGGANNNFNPGGSPAWPGTLLAPYGRLDLNPPADCSLTGLLAGLDGQLVYIRNISAFNITLDNLNAGSTAANQFSSPGDMMLTPRTAIPYA